MKVILREQQKKQVAKFCLQRTCPEYYKKWNGTEHTNKKCKVMIVDETELCNCLYPV